MNRSVLMQSTCNQMINRKKNEKPKLVHEVKITKSIFKYKIKKRNFEIKKIVFFYEIYIKSVNKLS